MSFYQKLFFLLIVGLFSLGIACGGSSSSSSNNDSGDAGSTNGSGSALTVTDKVTVVDAEESTSSNISALKFALPKTLPSDTNSPYYTDEQNVWMEEKSAESFDIINEILCIMDQMGDDFMINQGWYIAQVDIALCDNNSDDAEAAAQGQQDQSSGGGTDKPEYEFYTAGFSRENGSAPEYGNIWMHFAEDEFEPPMLIQVNLVITESKDEAPPFGAFEMYFKAFIENEDGTLTDEVIISGFLKSERQEDDSLILKFYADSNGDEFGFTERVAMIREGNNSFGVMAGEESFEGETHERNYRISSNDTYFARDDGNEVICESRNNPVETVHSYGLYDPTTGARLERNGGFSIYVPGSLDDPEDRIHGWASYWGIHIDDDQTISDGDTVYKEEWGPPEEQTDPIAYTVFKRGGKLVKHTRKTMTLGEIHGIPLSYYQCNEEGCTDYCTYWDSSALKFYNYGTRSYDTYQCEEFAPVAVTFSTNEWSFHAWCESCGGSIEVELRDANEKLVILKNTDPVIFYLEETMTASVTDVPTELVCASECPDPSAINTDSPHFVKSMWETTDNFELVAEKVEPTKLVEGTHHVKYTVNDLTLQYKGTDVVMEDSVASDWGVWSGPLIKPSDVSKLQCDWTNENNVKGTCFWKGRTELDVYWTWETGSNSWNQYTALQDSNGNIVFFDHPLDVQYKHSDGATYQLQFEGHRNLHGIPGICMSWETGGEVSCSEGGDIRWIPQFSILDGSLVTDVASDATYLVKGLDKEQRMEIVDSQLCEEAGLKFRLDDGDLPHSDEFVDFDIGTEPVVTDPPAMIAGEYQGEE